MKLRPLFLSPLLAAALQLGVGASALAETLRTVTIFSINDFHGNLQASQPVPYQFPRMQDGKAVNGAAGGYAYLVTKLKERRAAVGDSIFKRLMDAIGRPDLGAAPDLANNTGRVARVEEIDAAIGAWSAQRTVQQVLDALGAARVPAGKVYTAKDIAEDPHYRARDMLLTQQTRDGYSVEVPGIVPKLSATPGTIRSSAPHLGDDTDAVLAEMGLNAEQIALLRSKGVVQ